MDKSNLGVAIFDFDWSLAEEDSDSWTFNNLAPELWEQEQKKGMQWTDMVDAMFCKVQDKGATLADITNAVKDLPFSLSMTQVLKDLKSRSVPVIILSDANQFFIETVLNANGVRDCVTEIITNPTYIDGNGRLRVNRFLKSTQDPHNCTNPCTANLCKGVELEKIMARYGPLERIAYTGDGTNDFCPGTRLRQHDMYFLREGKSLDAYLKTDPKLETKLICQQTRWIEPSTVWKHMPVFFS